MKVYLGAQHEKLPRISKQDEASAKDPFLEDYDSQRRLKGGVRT